MHLLYLVYSVDNERKGNAANLSTHRTASCPFSMELIFPEVLGYNYNYLYIYFLLFFLLFFFKVHLLITWADFTFNLKQSVSVFDSYKLEVIPPQKFKNDPGQQQWRSESEDKCILWKWIVNK